MCILLSKTHSLASHYMHTIYKSMHEFMIRVVKLFETYITLTGELSHGVVTPKDCPAGFYCPNGTETKRQYPCPIGTYSNSTNLENQEDCRFCPPGYYCEATNITEPTGKCDAGYYCILAATSPQPTDRAEGGICPQGTWCEEGWSNPTPCPKVTTVICYMTKAANVYDYFSDLSISSVV